MAILENRFQAKLKARIKTLFPGCVVLKNDPNSIQGIPDLLVLKGPRWAALECKRSKIANRQPNQEYYVEKLNGMGFARFVYPENADEVLKDMGEWLDGGDINALERSYKVKGNPRFSEREQTKLAE